MSHAPRCPLASNCQVLPYLRALSTVFLALSMRVMSFVSEGPSCSGAPRRAFAEMPVARHAWRLGSGSSGADGELARLVGLFPSAGTSVPAPSSTGVVVDGPVDVLAPGLPILFPNIADLQCLSQRRAERSEANSVGRARPSADALDGLIDCASARLRKWADNQMISRSPEIERKIRINATDVLSTLLIFHYF